MTQNLVLNLAITVVVTIMSGLATLFLSRIEHPAAVYKDQAVEIENTRRDGVAAIIGTIIAEAHKYVEEVSEDRTTSDFGQEEQAIVIVQEAFDHADDNEQANPGIGDERISSLNDAIEHMAEPRTVYHNCKTTQDNAFYLFAGSLVTALFSAFIFLVLNIYPQPREFFLTNLLASSLITGLSLLSIIMLGLAVAEAFRWDGSREKLDSMLEESVFTLEPRYNPLQIQTKWVIYLYAIMTVTILLVMIIAWTMVLLESTG